MNNRITPKERNLLKGAVRRVFSRSDLRRKIVDLSRVDYYDAERPRVKKWSICPSCKKYIPTYQMQVDHIDPIIPINTAFEHMSLDEVVDRTWCEEHNLLATCIDCHKLKTKQENKLRREQKKKGKI